MESDKGSSGGDTNSCYDCILLRAELKTGLKTLMQQFERSNASNDLLMSSLKVVEHNLDLLDKRILNIEDKVDAIFDCVSQLQALQPDYEEKVPEVQKVKANSDEINSIQTTEKSRFSNRHDTDSIPVVQQSEYDKRMAEMPELQKQIPVVPSRPQVTPPLTSRHSSKSKQSSVKSTVPTSIPASSILAANTSIFPQVPSVFEMQKQITKVAPPSPTPAPFTMPREDEPPTMVPSSRMRTDLASYAGMYYDNNANIYNLYNAESLKLNNNNEGEGNSGMLLPHFLAAGQFDTSSDFEGVSFDDSGVDQSLKSSPDFLVDESMMSDDNGYEGYMEDGFMKHEITDSKLPRMDRKSETNQKKQMVKALIKRKMNKRRPAITKVEPIDVFTTNGLEIRDELEYVQYQNMTDRELSDKFFTMERQSDQSPITSSCLICGIQKLSSQVGSARQHNANHIRVEHLGMRYRCPVCLLIGKNGSNMRTHCYKQHEGIKAETFYLDYAQNAEENRLQMQQQQSDAVSMMHEDEQYE